VARNANDPSEFLRGPLVYGAVHVFVTLLWIHTAFGYDDYDVDVCLLLNHQPLLLTSRRLVLFILCVGDGTAAIVGIEVPSAPLPWNRHKSVAGKH
jgi:hypothetical protein